MKIKTITASESIETIQPNGLKRWKKTEMTAEITPGEDEHQATIDLHKKAELINSAIVFSVKLPEPAPYFSIPEKQLEKGSDSDIVKEIESCQDLKTLKTYWRMAQLKPEYLDAYGKQSIRLGDTPKKKNGKPVLP